MSCIWRDPPCPVVTADGTSPSWLVLQSYPGGGRDWYCSLCEQWAVSNHLSGRRHQNRLWVLSDRSCASMSTSNVLTPIPMRSCGIREQCGNVTPASVLRSEGSLLDLRSCSSNLAGGLAEVGMPCFLITSMAQISPSVVEELIALASSRLGDFGTEPGDNETGQVRRGA